MAIFVWSDGRDTLLVVGSCKEVISTEIVQNHCIRLRSITWLRRGSLPFDGQSACGSSGISLILMIV